MNELSLGQIAVSSLIFISGIISGFIISFFGLKLQSYRDRCGQHQEFLISHLRKWLNPESKGFVTKGSQPIECPPPPIEFDTHVHQHLDSAYPEAVQLFDELKDINSDCSEWRTNLISDLKSIVFQKYDELGDKLNRRDYDAKNFADAIVNNIGNKIKTGNDRFKPKIEPDPEIVLKIDTGEAWPKDIATAKELEHFYYKLVKSEHFISEVDKVIKKRIEYDKKSEKLREFIGGLVTDYEAGKRIEGECRNCPTLFKNKLCKWVT